jgi:hypothetical protein
MTFYVIKHEKRYNTLHRKLILITPLVSSNNFDHKVGVRIDDISLEFGEQMCQHLVLSKKKALRKT